MGGMQKYDNSVYMIHNENVFLPYNHLHSRVILWFTYRWWLFLFRMNVGYMIIELLAFILVKDFLPIWFVTTFEQPNWVKVSSSHIHESEICPIFVICCLEEKEYSIIQQRFVI